VSPSRDQVSRSAESKCLVNAAETRQLKIATKPHSACGGTAVIAACRVRLIGRPGRACVNSIYPLFIYIYR
jgi:hypothetical protein